MSNKRTVLIGKGRRVTIEEVLALAMDKTAVVEWYDSSKKSQEELPPSLPAIIIDSNVVLNQAQAIQDSEMSLLSSVSTMASLVLLALTLAQERVLLIDGAMKGNGAVLSQAVLALISFVQEKGIELRMSSNVSSYLEQLKLMIGVSDLEISSSILRRVLNLAMGAISTGLAKRLSQVADPIAALSAERVSGVDASAYADSFYDAIRPHRESVTSAQTMRSILNGSQLVPITKQGLKYGSASDETVSAAAKAVMNAPQQIGPARESIKAAFKVIELEMNCSEPDGRSNYDESVFAITLENVNVAVSSLRNGSYARRDVNPTSSSQSDDLPTLCVSCEQNVFALKDSLEAEAMAGAEFVSLESVRAEEEAKAKEAEKAAKAAAFNASNSGDGSNTDEFAGMSEEKKAKILKKRAEKEAKARAKAASKEKKKVSIFGNGTLAIIDTLRGDSDSVKLTNKVSSDIVNIVEKLLSGGVQRKPKIPKGTRDYLPEQMMIRDQAFQIIRRVFKRHGAVEIDTPVFELKDTLTGKYGEDSKLIYDLADQGGELLALRYDLTVPFARFIALNSVGNIKRFHIGKVYRRDQPVLSKGRYREFYQCDFDIAGNFGRMVPDSECVAVACEILGSLPIGDFGIKLNHRRLLDAILDICGVASDKFRSICSAVDKLDKEPWAAVKNEMVEKGLKEEVADRIGEFVLQKGKPWEMYHSLMNSKKFGDHRGANEAMEDLRIMFEYLESMGKLDYISFDLSLARGLDYYTGVIYEAVCLSGTTQVGSIGGGGRYDNLVSMFQEAGKQTPCVGVSVGIERVFTLMEARLREQQGGSIKQANVNVLVASVGDNMMKERMRVAQRLWDANISAEFSQQENPKLKYELADALERGIPFMVIVGEDELKTGCCKVKHLVARTEDLVPLDTLDIFLREKGVVPVGCEFAAEEAKRTSN